MANDYVPARYKTLNNIHESATNLTQMLIIYVVREPGGRSTGGRVNAPSGTVVWRLPDRRELAVLWQSTAYRI
jgi:hypothetical protein